MPIETPGEMAGAESKESRANRKGNESKKWEALQAQITVMDPVGKRGPSLVHTYFTSYIFDLF